MSYNLFEKDDITMQQRLREEEENNEQKEYEIDEIYNENEGD